MNVISDAKTKTIYSFSNNGKFIHQPVIGYNDKKEVVLLGLYKEKYNGRLSGVFCSEPVISAQTKTLSNLKFTPFPSDLLKLIDNDNRGKSSGNDPGLDNEFHPGYIVSVSDGVNHLIIEYFVVNRHATTRELINFVIGDLLVSTFQANGKVFFQRLPRNQLAPNT